MADVASTPEPASSSSGDDQSNWGTMLAVWMVATIVLYGVVWTTGVKDYDLAEAVERGAGRVEMQQKGEESEDVIRKGINLQRDTLPFWTVIALIGDFLFAPLSMFVRPLMVAVAFSAVAAVSGRKVRFPAVMFDSVAWQGVWVIGLAVQVVLMLALRRSHIETSIMLLFPPGDYSATSWVMLRQLDSFAMLGWLGMAASARQRGQANWLVALLVCLSLWATEVLVWASASLIVNLSMRSALLPS